MLGTGRTWLLARQARSMMPQGRHADLKGQDRGGVGQPQVQQLQLVAQQRLRVASHQVHLQGTLASPVCCCNHFNRRSMQVGRCACYDTGALCPRMLMQVDRCDWVPHHLEFVAGLLWVVREDHEPQVLDLRQHVSGVSSALMTVRPHDEVSDRPSNIDKSAAARTCGRWLMSNITGTCVPGGTCSDDHNTSCHLRQGH